MENNTNNSLNIYIVGGALGLATGLVAAYLFNRAAGENEQLKTGNLSSGDLVKLGLLLLGTVRQVAELGSGSEK
ncbi:MAG: hypothetical protein K8I82_25370 [Anaerolineae bacterium]|nr:hypothetical protein [Anaerolineae bacterium]